MKVYKVSKFRTNGQNFQDMHDPEIRTKNPEVGRYFLVTKDDNLLSKDRNLENGVPFFGTWTDNFEEFKKDNTIELYCVVDNHSRICPNGNMLDVETEERKHEVEDIIDNALTEEDCRAWAEGNLTDNVKQLMKEHNIKQLNIWDDVCEIVEFDSEEKKTGIKTITDLEIGDYATQNNEVAEVKGLYGSQYKYYANTDREYIPENTKINEVNDLFVDYVND